jgi:peptide/nickel transport system ATP-binding protein
MSVRNINECRLEQHQARSEGIDKLNDEILEVSNLTTRFSGSTGDFIAVNRLSLSLRRGETLAVVGESGSGKSVTALSVMRLTPMGSCKVDGSVKFQGRELLSLPDADMRDIRGNDIAMIFQEPMTSLNPVHSVGSQIGEVLVRHRGMSRSDARRETLRLMQKVRIPSAERRIDDYPHNFSGGMRQRVMIAMALACNPKVLIADEPTTALDVTIQAQILQLIKTLQSEMGMAVLFITHDMGVVAEIADRMVVMYQGQAVETGTTLEIFSNPKHPYTRSLLASVPKLGSMSGYKNPVRFPVVDRVTGMADTPREVKASGSHSASPLLEVTGLTKRFDLKSGLFSPLTGRIHAVENVSFKLAVGETLSLVGESGCGKSTTGRAILRLIEPDSGSVTVAGTDITRLSRTELRHKRHDMQMIFQDPFASLNPRLSIGAAIAEPLHLDGNYKVRDVRDRVSQLLLDVGLSPSMADRYPHEFSGGQRQRICIARALSRNPKLIVSDEAVSALDVSVKSQVINLMLDLQERLGLGYLFISHDMGVVERVSHRVAVMYLGEIVEIGPRHSIFENPQHPYTKKLLAAVPVADPKLKPLSRVVANDEIRSPLRAPDYVAPLRRYIEISPGHQVMSVDGEWSRAS